MLDENLPTYRFKPSSDNPFHTLLFFTHHGSDPTAEYLVKRPRPSTSRNQYAVGLLDAQNSGVIYAEVLLKPEWSQPTLSAAEVRAGNGNVPQIPIIPDTFSVSLYNPDQSIVIKQIPGSWGKSDIWEFEMPERTFKLPSASQIDQSSSGEAVSELVPKVVLRWKRDGRLSRDMTCYMCGRSVGGKKSKEPDITIALFRGKADANLTIYEPNMARVEVEDRKGLEMALLMSAEVIRDLYLNPRQDPFNAAVSMAPGTTNRRRTNSPPAAAMSGGLGVTQSTSPPPKSNSPTQASDARRQSEIDAETQRLKAMVAEEERQSRERNRQAQEAARERERRDEEEAKRIKKMLEKEEKDRRRREAEVEKETERLRKEFGVQGQDFPSPTSPSPSFPPRPTVTVPTGWPNTNGPPPSLPQRPVSVGPPSMSPFPHQGPQFAPPPIHAQNGGKKKHGFGNFLSSSPYAGPAAASVSGFFGRDDGRKKVQKKRSVHF